MQFSPRTRPPPSSFGSQQPSQRPSQTPHSCPQTLQPLLPRQANDAMKRCWKCGADAASRAPDAPPRCSAPRCPAPDAPPPVPRPLPLRPARADALPVPSRRPGGLLSLCPSRLAVLKCVPVARRCGGRACEVLWIAPRSPRRPCLVLGSRALTPGCF